LEGIFGYDVQQFLKAKKPSEYVRTSSGPNASVSFGQFDEVRSAITAMRVVVNEVTMNSALRTVLPSEFEEKAPD